MPDATPVYPTTPCRTSTCRKPVIWAFTVGGSRMPVDAEPVKHGTIVLDRGSDGRLTIRFVGVPQWPDHPVRYRSHFATCPAAQDHRRDRRAPN
jgi:hypothetical protein